MNHRIYFYWLLLGLEVINGNLTPKPRRGKGMFNRHSKNMSSETIPNFNNDIASLFIHDLIKVSRATDFVLITDTVLNLQFSASENTSMVTSVTYSIAELSEAKMKTYHTTRIKQSIQPVYLVMSSDSSLVSFCVSLIRELV